MTELVFEQSITLCTKREGKKKEEEEEEEKYSSSEKIRNQWIFVTKCDRVGIRKKYHCVHEKERNKKKRRRRRKKNILRLKRFVINGFS